MQKSKTASETAKKTGSRLRGSRASNWASVGQGEVQRLGLMKLTSVSVHLGLTRKLI